MKLRSCVILLYVTAVLAQEEWLEVQTLQGPVRGRKHPSEDLYAFYNIPYATGPTGVYKFKAPLPPPIWSEPFDAIEVNFVCPQNSKVIKEFFPKRSRIAMSENCLTANIFVPKTPEENLSVLVYVHGGGFLIGYGNRNKGTQLMKKKDFIMVTFNYRLGVHGFLCLGTKDIPGNAGMKDQVELLRWVQKNIAGFGGNPDDVTLAGASSGSASVDLIMLSKSAEGLFHRVIPESGGNLAAFAVQRNPVKIAKYYAKKLNFTNVHDMNALEDFYKTIPLKLLTSVSLFDRTDSTFLFSPCVEIDTGRGAFLTESPYMILQKGKYKKVPMLYGFTSMEGMLRIGHYDIWKHMMYNKFSNFLPADLMFRSEKERENVAETIKLFYFGKKSIVYNTVLSFLDFISDVVVTFPMLRAVQLHVQAGHEEIYLYQYSFSNGDFIPYTNIHGTDHCAQSKAWLDDVDGKNESLENVNYQNMRTIVREIWHNFIKTGNPVPPGSSLPAWPPVGLGRSPHMSLGMTVKLGGSLLKKICHFWNAIYQLYYCEAVPPPSLMTRSSLRNIKYYRPMKSASSSAYSSSMLE